MCYNTTCMLVEVRACGFHQEQYGKLTYRCQSAPPFCGEGKPWWICEIVELFCMESVGAWRKFYPP
jgi:hypothetical protein